MFLKHLIMKKTLLIALAGMMLFAFTQCGGGGSKEFKDNKALLDKMEKAVKDANSCDEMESSLFSIAMEAFGNDYNYTDDEKMTENEETELEKLSKKLDDLYTKKAKDLGCDEEKYDSDSDWDDFDDVLDDFDDVLDDAKEELEDAFESLF